MAGARKQRARAGRFLSPLRGRLSHAGCAVVHLEAALDRFAHTYRDRSLFGSSQHVAFAFSQIRQPHPTAMSSGRYQPPGCKPGAALTAHDPRREWSW